MNPYTEVTAEELKSNVVMEDQSTSSAVEYEIEGADNPEDNGTYKTEAGSLVKSLTPEQMLRQRLKQLKRLRRAVSAQLRVHENQRTLESRTTKRRKKNKLEKASRKRNRR